jgi:hypothetical protein
MPGTRSQKSLLCRPLATVGMSIVSGYLSEVFLLDVFIISQQAGQVKGKVS